MKLYLFYEIMRGLEPRLYGYTTDRGRAQFFRNLRKGFYYKTVDAKKNEVQELLLNSGDLEIDLQSFKTSTDGFRHSITLPATKREIKQIILHEDELALRELQKHAIIPMEAFSEEMQEALRELSYPQALGYWEEVEAVPFYHPDLNHYEAGFRVDQVGLFLVLHKDTIDEDYLRAVLRKE